MPAAMEGDMFLDAGCFYPSFQWTGNPRGICQSLTLSKILCKWKQDSVVSLFLYLNSVFKHKHKLIHNQAPV